jgi:hypothetical protein
MPCTAWLARRVLPDFFRLAEEVPKRLQPALQPTRAHEVHPSWKTLTDR